MVLGTFALLLALVIKAFLVQAFYIPSGSMEMTLQINDRVLVNKLVYRFRDIHRGEIVVFNGVDSFSPEVAIEPPANAFEAMRRKVVGLLGLGTPGEKDFIKRVIGVPGDVVACCTTNGRITVNGEEVVEPYLYLTSPKTPQTEFEPVTVEPGKLFVMGDHRDGSSDSRTQGLVPSNRVVGRAFVVLWPPGHAKTLGVPDTWRTASALPASPWSPVLTPPVLGLVGALPVALLRRRRRRIIRTG